MNNPIKKDQNRNLIQEDIQMANKHMKRCATSYAIRELQIKTKMNTHIWNMNNIKYWRRCGATGILIHWLCHAKWYSQFGRQFVTFYETKHTLKIWSSNYPLWYLSKWVFKKCPQLFIGTLFITAKSWKQPRCSSVGKWIKNWYI